MYQRTLQSIKSEIKLHKAPPIKSTSTSPKSKRSTPKSSKKSSSRKRKPKKATTSSEKKNKKNKSKVVAIAATSSRRPSKKSSISPKSAKSGSIGKKNLVSIGGHFDDTVMLSDSEEAFSFGG